MMKTEDIVKVGKVWVYKIKETGDYGDEETKVKTTEPVKQETKVEEVKKEAPKVEAKAEKPTSEKK